jgi:dolichol-phosphate mannosyltransferase
MTEGTARRSGRPLVSIVCPVLNEEAVVPIFYERLQKILAGLRARYEFELIFTNNRSTDRTLEVICELRARDPAVQVLTFSRNFGYQASILAGLQHARGDAMTIIDVDCEDPPEMLAVFIAEWERGHDVVYGIRAKRNEPRWLQATRKLFYRVNRLVADSDVILDMAEFFLITRAVRDAITANASTFPFLRTEVAFVGFDSKGIPYERQKRAAGRTHYNLAGLWVFATAGIMASTTLPLRLAGYLFPGLVAVDVALFAWSMATGSVGAFRALVATTLLYLAFFATAVSIYQARIYKNVVRRPLYIVDWRKSHLDRRDA